MTAPASCESPDIGVFLQAGVVWVSRGARQGVAGVVWVSCGAREGGGCVALGFYWSGVWCLLGV